MLHVLTGDGKGKTSAAMGMALRMLGHGGAVLAAQFLKDGSSGELEPLRRLGAEVLACGTPRGFYPLMDEAEQRREREREAAFAQALAGRIRETRPALVILDELAPALDTGALPRAEAEALLSACGGAETVVTGRGAPAWLTERADYLTECRALRHPYERGLEARAGVEF